ncbi:hypothetical protein BDV97DRAFT_423868 [Delphinella strobiligena]|nr:hypothetical protein BDV97DRAFT_423868 [Delphinella strobiligena]
MSGKDNTTPTPIASGGENVRQEIKIPRTEYRARHNKRRGGESAPPNTPHVQSPQEQTPHVQTPVLPVEPVSIMASIPLFGTPTAKPTATSTTKPTPTPTQVSGTITGTHNRNSAQTPASMPSRSGVKNAVLQEGSGKVAPPNTPFTPPGDKTLNPDEEVGGIEGSIVEDEKSGFVGEEEGGVEGEGDTGGGEEGEGDTVDGENRDTASGGNSDNTNDKEEEEEEDAALTDATTDDSTASDGVYGDETQTTDV